MQQPLVTIILPVFNTAAFIAATIESVLKQTYQHFELLVLDDGSTDASAKIIKSFSDQRIRYIANDKNYGLIYTLNKGLQLANGDFIARLDGDDICEPTRLEKQVAWLLANPSTAMVASTIKYIDASGHYIDTVWPQDLKYTTAEAIKQYLPKDNCIAHPTVMFNKKHIQDVHYRDLTTFYGSDFLAHNAKEKNLSLAEDYDLWLWMLSLNKRIDKINEPLLLYRTHTASITGNRRQAKNVFEIHFQCKRRFLRYAYQHGQWNAFCNRVLFYTIIDGIMSILKNVKRKFKK
ncbi:MAG TPA: hypothetical protein DCQ29_00940 [Chitinophagaceae bacterium]|nr:hypothetical protein [Chitinophagaceae bacterium]